MGNNNHGHQIANAILRMPALTKRVGLQRSHIYSLIRRDEFPAPVPLGKRARGWLESEIDEWINARTEERDAQSRPIKARAAKRDTTHEEGAS